MSSKGEKDKLKVDKDKQLLQKLRHRMAVVVGKLNSVDRLSTEGVSALHHELYSIKEALGAQLKLLQNDLVQEVIDFIEEGNLEEAKVAAKELQALIQKRAYQL